MQGAQVIARSGLDRESTVSGLNLDSPSGSGSRAVQADVGTGCGFHIEIGLDQQVATERFQKALRDSLDFAEGNCRPNPGGGARMRAPKARGKPGEREESVTFIRNSSQLRTVQPEIHGPTARVAPPPRCEIQLCRVAVWTRLSAK